LTNTSVVGYEYYRYREQGEIDWIEGVVVNVGNEVRLDAELTALEPATAYEWEARILCEESAEWVYVPGPDFTTLSTPSDPTADLRFLPSMDCSNGIFKARIQIRGASIDSFSVGTTSILCTYNDAALQFSSYQSLNFDGSDLCVVGVASSWDDHTVDGISISGVFNLTMVLNSEQFSCPSIQPNEWTDIGEISFSILDEGLSPSLFFNISNTNFNIDQPNDGSVQVGKGNFQGLEGNILECEENSPPVASFTATPRSGQAPLVVNFDASASTDSDGSISSYEWDLGNGLTSSGESFQYTYTAKGDNIVKLVVTDNLGAKDTIAIMVSVSEPNQPPVASFIVDPQTGSVPLLAEFFANGSSDSDGEIVAYNWDFGDGTGGEGRYITHVYDAVGSYTARLIVVDNQGANDTVTQTITVVPQSDLDPFADLRIVDSLDCENNTLYTTLQIRAANGQVFKIGTSSILLKFNESALQFQNYQSLSFDGSDRCIAGIVEAWDQHSYNVISFPGLFNLTMLLNTEQFSCPEITQNEWISIGTLEFSIKDERLSPEILFDRLNTNFNFDEPNDGSVQVGKGEFTGFTGNVLSCSPSDCQSTNLAFGKPSSQSSTYGNGVPTIAVDGNTAGQGSPWGANASLQHTQSEASPWWEVDLEEIANIDSIRVYNRTSCCQDRLSNVYVLVASEPFSPSASLEDLLTNSNITHVQLTGIPSDTILTFSFAATGRYVRLQLPDDGVNSPLHIAEVEVYGCVDENQVQPISFSVNTTNAICLSESVGVISIENLSGGQGPYSFSIDGGCSFTSQAVFQNLDWGDYLVVVKDSVGNSESQMVHIVSEENGLAITEGQRIIDPLQAQGRMTGNHFGYKLVVQGDEALVGARWDEPDSTGLPDNFNSGSVGVLQKQGEDWVLVDRLFPDTPRLEAFFGIALAISG
ncbi:MAG: PKD domain-containing protein, partial [Bacteroidota bacterium]